MSEQLLDLLKLCLLVLLYLFFLRVMWAVFSELRAPVAAPVADPATVAPTEAPAAAERRRARRTSRSRLQPPVLRSLAPGTTAGAEHVVTGEMTIGRAPGCSIVVDDTYASQLHARVYLDDRGRPAVEDLGSTNGTSCNGETITTSRQLRRGDRIQVGNTVWELV